MDASSSAANGQGSGVSDKPQEATVQVQTEQGEDSTRPQRKPGKFVLPLRDVSRGKIKRALGLSESEMQQVELELSNDFTTNESNSNGTGYSERKPSSCVKNRKNCEKALAILGIDPSHEKLKGLLDLQQDELDELLAAAARVRMRIAEKELSTTVRDRRNSGKALEILGHNPPKEKLKATLGVDEDVLDSIEEEIHAELMQRAQRQTSSAIKNRKDAAKALQVLGHDPSEQKLKHKFGVDSKDDLKEQPLSYFVQMKYFIIQNKNLLPFAAFGLLAVTYFVGSMLRKRTL